MNIGMFALPGKPQTMEFIRDTADELRAMGHAPCLCYYSAQALGQAFDPGAWEGVELIIAAGGDGTFLAVQQIAAPKGVPVLCVHMGKVGYLSETDPDRWREAFHAAVRGESAVEERLMLEARIEGQRPEHAGLALNDVVLNRVGRRILTFEVTAGGQALGKYAADGLVVATPTGSTAYALSCGGPIVHPGVACLILAPISPHTISARPFVLPVDVPVSVTVLDPEEGAALALDGGGECTLRAGETATIELSTCRARFIRVRKRNFYGLLRAKIAEPGL